MSDARVPMTAIASAFGVPITVMRPEPDAPAPVATTGIWIPESRDGAYAPVEERPFGRDRQRREPRRLMGISRDVVSEIPRASLVDAPEVNGGPVLKWLVDAIDRVDVDEIRVLLVPARANL
jgi:hypothetical protein